MIWHDAKTISPPRNGRYLVILETVSPVRHCKRWAGMGKPEIGHYHTDYPNYKWSGRGTLTVAFWAYLPAFDASWDEGVDGEPGRWVFNRETHDGTRNK